MILKIEKNVYEGKGLAHDDNGAVVFVDNATEGDVVEARILKKHKNFIEAEVKNIIEPSCHRIKPECPYSKPCGACNLGFVEYEFQLKIKENITKEIFSKFNGVQILPIIKSPEIRNFRAKVQYPAGETKNSKRILAGYYKKESHEIINIKYCPMQPEIIDKIIDFIRNNWTLGCYAEKTNKGLLRHINARISKYNNDILLTLVLNSNNCPDIKDFANLIMNNFPQIKGVSVNLNSGKTNKITGDKTILIKGKETIEEHLSDKKYKIGSNSFFQVNPKCAELLFDAAKSLIKEKGSLLDLYGGSGTIGIYMSDKATKITLVEENKESINLAKENYKLNNIEKYEVFEGKAKDTIKKFIKEKKSFKNIIIDPPRKGSDSDTLNSISKMTDSIIYISCNPMTLKRDADIIIKNGFKFLSVQPADMFPNTHHIELVAHFRRVEE